MYSVYPHDAISRGISDAHVFVCPSVRPSQTGVVTCIEAVELIGLVFRMYGFRLIYRTRRILC